MIGSSAILSKGVIPPHIISGLLASAFNTNAIAVLYDQYVVFNDSLSAISETIILQSGSRFMRIRVVGDELHYDITLTHSGFSGSENTDWVNLLAVPGQDVNFRHGVSGGAYVIDCEITATGFAGTEDIDWERLYSTSDPTSSETDFRVGIRNAAIVIDQALTATGFAGAQNTDWVELVNMSN